MSTLGSIPNSPHFGPSIAWYDFTSMAAETKRVSKLSEKLDEQEFATLIDYLTKIPGIEGTIGRGSDENGRWWVKFTIDTDHEMAWNVVQEMGHVLNYISLDERLPTVFYPVSPPPYLNGGPEFLSWVIENKDPEFRPAMAQEWLEGRLPRPVDDLEKWSSD